MNTRQMLGTRLLVCFAFVLVSLPGVVLAPSMGVRFLFALSLLVSAWVLGFIYALIGDYQRPKGL